MSNSIFFYQLQCKLSTAKIRLKYVVLAADKKPSAAKMYIKYMILAADKKIC